LCRDPDLACEVTLQPIDRFGFDAAILFSDILVVLPPMGLAVEFGEGGPRIAAPIGSAHDVDRLAIPDPSAELPYVLEAVRRTRAALAERVPLIGFAGAPFTLACYAVDGGGSKDWARTRALMHADPAAFGRLLDRLAQTVALYLAAQIEAGAQAVQLFDSWAGVLAPADFRDHALAAARQVIDLVRASGGRGGGRDVPIIYFVNGCAPYLDDCAASRADVLGVDWRVELAEVRRRIGGRMALQGNLDPVALFASDERLRARVAEVLRGAAGAPGHIFNLGHGILPSTDPAKVKLVVDTVRELSSAGAGG
jgi:uroporphyrinogen decarboxylase